MLIWLRTRLLYSVIISLGIAAPIDVSVRRAILSSKESPLPTVNVTSSSETSRHPVPRASLPLTSNATLPLTPNATLPPVSNFKSPQAPNAILPPSFDAPLAIITRTTLHAALDATQSLFPNATLPPTPNDTILPGNRSKRFYTPPTLAAKHPVSLSRAARNCSERASHPHGRDGLPPTARHRLKISWPSFEADATAAASSWKTPMVRTAQPTTAGSSSLYTATGCGVSRVLMRSRRIVNGTVARPGQWPWMVNVARKDVSGGYTNICGGALVTDRHVVTAAHCTYDTSVTLSIILGGLSRWINTNEIYVTKIMGIRSIRRHDRSSWTAFANDIAIIELEYPVTFTNSILPICLPDHASDFLGHLGTILGWGKIHEDAYDFSSTLRQAEIPIQSRETCLEWYHSVGFKPVLRPEFMCAGHENGGKDACGGDSGGPLMVQDEWGRWVLAGIVSHGYGCAEPNQPGIYINVSFYLPWIQEQLAL